MLRRGLLLVLVLVSVGASARVASADPVNAKTVGIFTAVCGSQQVQVAVNGNGVFCARARDRQHGRVRSDGLQPHVRVHADWRRAGD